MWILRGEKVISHSDIDSHLAVCFQMDSSVSFMRKTKVGRKSAV